MKVKCEINDDKYTTIMIYILASEHNAAVTAEYLRYFIFTNFRDSRKVSKNVFNFAIFPFL